ncbi:MAG TPA: hypothetical protein VHW47_08405 [Acidimicrobiales bacterium]|nr:hypothetical protein [Acidimicrobiales bacterium]
MLQLAGRIGTRSAWLVRARAAGGRQSGIVQKGQVGCVISPRRRARKGLAGVALATLIIVAGCTRLPFPLHWPPAFHCPGGGHTCHRPN